MLRTRRRNWSGCSATPIRARQTARKETAQGQAEADLRVRCWPQVERFRRLVPTAAECCSPRPTPAPDRPENPRRAWIPPISPLAPRPEPRQARMHSRPVCHGRAECSASGPAGESSASVDSAHLPSRPESTRTATSADASTTTVTSGLHHGRAECSTVAHGFPPPPCGFELLAATRRWRAARRFVPTRNEGIPAWTGVATPRAPRVRRGHPRGHL